MLVIGGGIIGLEMATVYSTLGTRIDVVEMLDGLMQGADRDLVKVWEKMNTPRFDKVMLKTKTVGAEATQAGIEVSFEGEKAPAEPQLYDLVLVAVGRSPNGKKIGADKAGVAVTDRGFIDVDKQMRTNVPHIFAIGDIVGQPMLAHKAVHEGARRGRSGARRRSRSSMRGRSRRSPTPIRKSPGPAYRRQCKAQGHQVRQGRVPLGGLGPRDRQRPRRRLHQAAVRRSDAPLIGGGIVGTHAGDLISEICLAIEMGCDAADIGKTIHPHPTLGESIGMAAEVFEGVCTDLPPVKKK